MILGLDIGSSSVKAGLLQGQRIHGKIVRRSYPTRFDAVRAEIDADEILKAIAGAIHDLGPAVKKIDGVALAVMAPSWLAMDKEGKPLTPVITHQDRRSVEIATKMEERIGKARHLKLAGNRPFPGGISSTTWGWFREHHAGLMKRADLVGHLSTYLHRIMTGARVTDPSNASFMGLYSTLTLGGWNDELCDAWRISKKLLPDVIEGNEVAGNLTVEAAKRFGLVGGTPVLCGMMDTSAATLLIGAKPGQLINVCGSTDVLALITDRPKAHEKLLTRAVGVGRRWMSVSTLAAGGWSFHWSQNQLFPDLTREQFDALLGKLVRQKNSGANDVQFEPYLAGERTSIEQRKAAFSGLTLASTREHMLGAVIEALAQASAARLELLRSNGRKFLPTVVISGGVQKALHEVLHRDWPKSLKFRDEHEATLRGLAIAWGIEI